MKKKFLALVLTLAMVLSLVPVTALATGATQPNIQNSGPVTSNDGYVDLEKTAAAVEESDNDNTFEITLKATVRNGTQEGTKTSTDAVLVIDRSASMEDGRINSAQEAAKQFAEVVLGSGANKENQIAVVSYADEAKRNIDLSSDLDTVKDAINFSAYGGTNIQAGIKAARDILQSSRADNKVILVLSDGEPTYSFRAVGTATQTGCWIGHLGYHHSGTINPDSVNITGFDYDSIAGSGRDYRYDYEWNSRRDSAKLQVTCADNKIESKRYPFYQNNGQPTIQEASYAKKAGYEIYSIYLGKPTETNAVSTMTEIATDNDHYKLATDASRLGELFKGIAKDITLPVTPGIVTDPMGDHMKLVADSLQGNSAVTTNDGGFTWDLTKVTPRQNEDGSRTYVLTYQIIFDTDFDGFDATKFYPTNKETTLSYTVQGDSEQKTAKFPIPKVKGTAAPTPDPDPTTDVYVYFQTQNTKGKPVDISGTSIQYNEHSWATLGKISTTQTLTSGETYTGEDNAILNAVGEQAKTDLNGEALYPNNQDIAAKVLPSITWISLQEGNGADGYQPAEVKCWHLDGKLTVYGVTYLPGVEAGMEVTNMPENTQTYYLKGTTYTVSSNVPQCTGYTFAGWKSSDDNTVYQTESNMQFTMPAKDVTLTAQWTPNNGTKYRVEHYQQQLDDTYKLKDTDTLSGETGASVIAQPKTTYTGFTCDKTVTGTVERGTIAADGSLVLKLYYTRNSYNVTYQYEGTAPDGAPDVNALSGTHKYEEEVIVDTTVSATAVAGYTFSDWSTDDVTVIDNTFTMPDKNVVFKGSWTPNTNTAYKVEHYQQQLDGTTYELKETDTLSGNTGDSVTAQPKTTYTGFTCDKTVTGTVESGTIAADGSLVLKLYYTRNSYKVSYELNGSSYSTDSTEKTYKYGATVTKEADPTIPEGNAFSGWTVETEGVQFNEDGQFTMPAKDVIVVGTYAENRHTYTIKGHLRDADGKDIESSEFDLDNGSQVYGFELSTLITEAMKKQRTEAGKNYVYVPSETTVTVNGGTSKLATNSKLTANDTVIDLYYYLDNWKDADETTASDDKDSETGGDDIPDCYQVLVKYQSGDTNRGSVGPLTMEVLTIKSNGVYASEGQVTATGSTAEATGRNYFSNWTNKDNTQVGTKATLEAQTIANAKGGATYTFTANFDRSSGSGSGGSNRPKPPVVEIPDDVPTGLNGKDHYAYVVGYPDGMVYPQKNITRAEVATIFFRLLTDETREANMTKSNSYNDMKDGAWYTCAVSTLSKMGIIKGYEDGSFKPDASISRAEFAAIAARFDPDGDKTPATFSDVSSHWAKDEISIAANHGWIKGYEDGSFKPDQKITRAETMTLVNRVLKRLPETKDDLHKDMKTWPDNQNESAWFYLAVQEATNSHYQKLKKDGTHETWESMRETRDWAALEK